MGGAIARGMAQGTIVRAADMTVSNRSVAKLEKIKAEFPDIKTTTDNRAAAQDADLLILAVKPWLMEQVITEIKPRIGQIVVSVAAGISINELAGMMPDRKEDNHQRQDNGEAGIFRLIPNTAISLRQSMTLIAAGNGTSPQTTNCIKEIFDEMGVAMVIAEQQMAAATAMTSCGIAYALKYIQAAMQAGIELGVYPKDGMRMVAQSLKGAAELILQNDTHPAVEIDKVCTPGGLTIKGINELEHDGYTSAIIHAIKKSCL